MITESRLNDDIPDSAVGIGRKFQVYHRDRQSPGGGILVYVENCTQTTRLTNLEDEDQKVLWLHVKPKRAPRLFSVIIVVGVYYPPGQTAENERGMNEYLTKGLDFVMQDFRNWRFQSNEVKRTLQSVPIEKGGTVTNEG